MMMSMKVLNEYLSSLDSSLQVVVDDQLPVLETAKLLGFGSVETVVLVAFVALALIRRREVRCASWTHDSRGARIRSFSALVWLHTCY
jgi:hypothetical protein